MSDKDQPKTTWTVVAEYKNGSRECATKDSFGSAFKYKQELERNAEVKEVNVIEGTIVLKGRIKDRDGA